MSTYCSKATYLFIIVIALMLLGGCSVKTYRASKRAENLFQKGAYVESLPYFIKSVNYGKDNSSWLLKAAQASLRAGDATHAYLWLDKVIRKEGYKELDAYRLMGQVLQFQEKFEDAIQLYKTWLREADRKNTKRNTVKTLLLQADRGMWMSRGKGVALVENFGDRINDSRNQFAALYSLSTPGKIYFTGEKNNPALSTDSFKIYSTFDNQGVWTSAEPLLEFPEYAQVSSLDIGGYGSSFLYYKGTSWKNGNIYVRNYPVNPSKDRQLGLPVNGFDGRNGLCLFRDSILFFASDKPGGYGGYDIYFTIYRKGHWETPVNLGPSINSKYDEITPFLCNDGRTLYFSTNSSYSIGGFDVVYSRLDDRTLSWSGVMNAGLPVNSGGDDTHFRINNDGYRALLSSNRQEGEGAKDIYNVFFNKLQTQQFYANDPFIFAGLYDEMKALSPSWADSYKYFKNKKSRNSLSNNIKQQYTLTIHPVFIRERAYLSAPRVIRYIEKIARVMKRHPRLRLEINAHLAGEHLPWKTIYNSFQKAETLRLYLQKLGVSPDRITTRGYGDRFQIAKESINKTVSEVGRKYNSRIEFRISGKSDYLKIEYREPSVPPQFRIRYPEKYPEGIYYKIYLLSTGQIFINPLISKQNKAIIERIGTKQGADYLIGDFKTYRDAQYGMQKLDKVRFNKIKIIPYYRGKRLDRNEIMDYVSKYPDLNNYLKENK